MDVAGILLAAGEASRFGAQKLLHPLADGTPLGVAAARNLVRVIPNSVAVIRPGDHDLSAALSATGLRIVENPFADQGLGSSLAAGVRATAPAAGWLIALADMPWVDAATIRRLADGLRDGAAMIAPSYRGTRGHPVGFSARWETQLRQLAGDTGARGLIVAHPEALSIEITDDAGTVMDVDHPQDLDRPGV
jgi:molybdenum cofactor cytidylyltransferase